jgi:capsular polysaccharide transport system permease protein
MTSMRRTPLQIQRDVIYALLLREVGSRVGRTRVGLFWALLEPAAHVAIPVALFGLLLGRSWLGVEYPVLLVYGLMPFVLFKTICLQTMEGTATSRALLSYRQVLLMDVFIARALACCAIEAVVFALILAALAMLGYDVLAARPLELAATLALTVVLAFGLGLLFAALASFMPDAKAVIRLLFAPLYLASGVLFPVSRLPDAWVQWLAFNPVLHLVELARVGGLEHYVPMRYLSTGFPVALALGAVFAGLALYRLRQLARVTA